VYVPVATEKFETWSTRASINIHGTKSVRIQGDPYDCVYVYEDVFRDEEGRDIRLLTPDSMTRARSLYLRMDVANATVEAEMAGAGFVVHEFIEVTGTWEGPILSSS
jgi:hypothetical protein